MLRFKTAQPFSVKPEFNPPQSTAYRLGRADSSKIYGSVYLDVGGPESATVADGPSGHYMLPLAALPADNSSGLLPGYTTLVIPPDGSIPYFQVLGATGGQFYSIGQKLGTAAGRPPYAAEGDQYFDTTLHKPLWYDGGWRDATGTLV